MSEQFHTNPEHHEFLLPSAEVKLLPDAAHAEALRAGEKDPLEARTEARDMVAAETAHEAAVINPLDQLKIDEAAAQAPTRTDLSADLRKVTLSRELNGIRRKLPATQRALSKVIHQPAVRVLSETAGQTVSRSSGLLGGGILAFIGSSGYLYLARHIGFEYNSGVFLALFVSGFAIGLGLELIVHVAMASRRKALDT